MLPDGVLDELVAIVGTEHVIVDDDVRTTYETDWTGRFVGRTPAVVRPANVDEVASVVACCRDARIAILPQGGNTGLVGGSVPLRGEVVVSTRRLDAIEPVDDVARQVTVGAGATVAAVQGAAGAAGLRYAVDLASRDTATIGGTIATNAGGLHVLRYGGTRHQVIGIEAVLGTGQVVRRLQGLVKDNTGYHFPSLLCGSEGTLGIVTAARLSLVPDHAHRVAALVAFETASAAVVAVQRWRARLDALEAAELFLDDGLRLVCSAFDLRAPFERAWPVYVIVEAADHDDPTDALAAVVDGTDGVGDVAVASGEHQRLDLWRLREDHTLAINTLGPPHKFDVTVPLARLAEVIDTTPAAVAAAKPEAVTWIFGHVGDGNVHINVTGLAPDDETIDDLVLRHVVELGGCISAEHGIGTAKRPWFALDRTVDEVDAMRAIKRALDPAAIMNPGGFLA